ncbi:nucleotide-binding domain-containing protein [Auricularia subglabra TFB-10046 SS5]|uniref:Nucleotide-binding domain-containing protein n=1 Tax=Auricularia subglabra (strain TFB-10046 / SS5) TaxID=717982 RepID=J0WTI5_AURST|nr:nucleotide-binding domain-containing protein [Auricularia subglabra TFB-10046 SS5]
MIPGQNPGLVLWRDLSPLPTPLKTPTSSSPHILIVGGGVTGLTTAWTLLDKGYRVTIVAKEWASYGKEQRLTSQIAGALWEFPPAVCGQHTDAISLAHSKRWCMIAYHIWDALSANKLSGVQMKPAVFFFPCQIETDSAKLTKMHEIIASGVRGFRRDPGIRHERRVNPSFDVVDAYEHLAPIIDTDAAMAFLKDLVTAKGAKFVTRTIRGDLFSQEHALRREFAADAIVNASGLASAELAADDSCYPIRGGLLRVINDGRDFPKVTSALSIGADRVHRASEIVFLVPRNDNILLIGGFTEPHEGKLDLTLESPIIKRMRARCEAFLPDLKDARLDPEYPLAQGLRPFRQRNVRVERELRQHGPNKAPSMVVHSYGQGGSGWSLAFGCAGDVATLVDEALQDLPARPMAGEPGRQEVVDLRDESGDQVRARL